MKSDELNRHLSLIPEIFRKEVSKLLPRDIEISKCQFIDYCSSVVKDENIIVTEEERVEFKKLVRKFIISM